MRGSSGNPDGDRAPLASGTPLPTWTIKLKQAAAGDYRSLAPASIGDLIVNVAYQATA